MADYNAWAGPYGLGLPERAGVRYLEDPEEPIWSEVLVGGVLWIQYNRVAGLGDTVMEPIRTALADPGTRRAIVDIRHNYGGDTFGYRTLLDALVAGRANLEDGLFLITGRNTFSAGSMFAGALQAATDVTVVGEPTGGGVNLYGNADVVELPWSKIGISIATAYFEGAPGDDRLTVDPALPVPLTFEDFLAGVDAPMDTIARIGD
jgi:hypothetical protein